MNGCQLAVCDRFGGARDEQQHHGDFHHDNDVVEVGGFFDADHQERRDDEDDDDRGQVEDRGDMRQGGGVGSQRLDLLGEAGARTPSSRPSFSSRAASAAGRSINSVPRAAASCGGTIDAKVVQERHDIARPADGDRDGADGVFEDQVPADDPGEQLAQRGVAIGVGAAGHRDERGEFAVAESGEDRSKAGQDKREHNCRPGVLRRDRSREHKDARADNGADAERGEVHGAERPVEALVGQRFGLQVGDTLSSKQVHILDGCFLLNDRRTF